MSARIRSLCAPLLAFGIVASPAAARACAVCFNGRGDEQREAFLITTGFLTVLPLILLGAGITWFIRRVRRLEAEHDAAAESARAEA